MPPAQTFAGRAIELLERVLHAARPVRLRGNTLGHGSGYARGRPRPRVATMLRCTSLVPPSIVFAMDRRYPYL